MKKVIKKTVLYIRVSTEEQADLGHSLENQKNRLLDYCSENKINNYEIYEDAGFSATNEKRPNYLKMMKEIKCEKIKEIIFLKIDRISRCTKNYLELIKICNENKVKLISLNEKIDMNANGKFLQILFSGLAEMESNKISERTKDGYVGGFEKGIYPLGGKLPLGISKNEEGNLYYNDDIKKVKFIVDLVDANFTYSEITKKFIKEFNITIGKNFVEQLLKKDLYRGYKVYNGKKYKVLEPIIHDKTKENKFRKNRNISKHIYKFSNIYYKNNKILYSTTARKKIKSTNKVKEYKYYFSYDRKIKINVSYLEKIININFKNLINETNDKNKEIIKRAKTLFLLGDIDKNEYAEIKNNVESIKNRYKTNINYEKIIVDENYNVELKYKNNNFIFNYKDEIKKIKF